jgi:hypothetical protein
VPGSEKGTLAEEDRKLEELAPINRAEREEGV